MVKEVCSTGKVKIKYVYPIEDVTIAESNVVFTTHTELGPSTISLTKIEKQILTDHVNEKTLKDGIVDKIITDKEFKSLLVDQRHLVLNPAEKYLAACRRFHLAPNAVMLRCLYGEDDTLVLRLAKLDKTNIYLALKNILEARKLIVTKLDLSYNDSAENIYMYLNEMVTEHEHLTWLSLSNSFLNEECVELVASSIEYALALTYLNLSNCSIGDEGGALIMTALTDNDLLEELDVSKNKFHTKTAKAMIPALKNNRTLRILNLFWNDFYPEKDGSMKIATALRPNKGLESVNLSWNGFSGLSFAKLMARTIRVNKVLQSLDLSNNTLYGDELLTILAAVERSASLKHIYFDNNIWDEESILSSINYMKNCERLETISIGKHAYVPKKFHEQAQLIMKSIPTLKIIYHAVILPNPPIQPEFKAVVLDRAKFLSMKPKKKKFRRDFTDIITTMHYYEKDTISKTEFLEILAKYKPKLDENLVNHLIELFLRKVKSGKAKRKQIFIKELADYYFKRLNMEVPEPVDPEKYVEKKKRRTRKDTNNPPKK